MTVETETPATAPRDASKNKRKPVPALDAMPTTALDPAHPVRRNCGKTWPVDDTIPVAAPLTREQLKIYVDAAVAASADGGGSAGLIIVSIPSFRCLIEMFGPQQGDEILRSVGRRMASPGPDMAFTCHRIGMAQFAILPEHLDDRQHLARIVRTLQAALTTRYDVGDISMDITPCFGTAQHPDDALTGYELLRRATLAQKYAHTHGISHKSYTPDLDQVSSGLSWPQMMSDFKDALANNELCLWYQPKLHLASGRVDSVEALLRWSHPQHGYISPDIFIPVAERAGLMQMTTAWVMNEAMRQAHAWMEAGLNLNVAMNIAPSDLHETRFPDRLLRIIDHYQVPANRFTLEVTESAAMRDMPKTIASLSALRTHGLRIALDDFGTGHASLAHLHRLPLDEIKLDRSFVIDPSNRGSRTIARATASLAREFGLDSVGEGTESLESQTLLRELGYTRTQGYYLSKPLPTAEFETWLCFRNATKAA